jgi:hypothetical protein
VPRARRVLPFLAVLVAGCSTPATGTDTLAAGRERVLALASDAARTLPPSAHPKTPFATGTTTCRRKFLGYAVGSTGRHRAEAPILVEVDDGADLRALLNTVDRFWQSEGFTVDRAELSDERYPKIHARTPDGYALTATGITIGAPRLDLYAVSQCLRGDAGPPATQP